MKNSTLPKQTTEQLDDEVDVKILHSTQQYTEVHSWTSGFICLHSYPHALLLSELRRLDVICTGNNERLILDFCYHSYIIWITFNTMKWKTFP